MMQSALFVLEFTNAKPSRILIPKELQSQINRKFSLILELCSRRHILVLTGEEESAGRILVEGSLDLMPFSRGIAHLCKTVNGYETNPVSIPLADNPISAVFGMCAAVRIDFKKLHAGIYRIDFTNRISNACICSIISCKGHIVVSSRLISLSVPFCSMTNFKDSLS